MKQKTPEPSSARRSRRSPYLWPGLVFALACLLAGSSYYLSMWWGSQLEQEYDRQKTALDKARRRQVTAREEVDIAGSYLERFRDLQQRHLIGEADRLRWSDGLQALAKRYALGNMTLQFSGQQELPEDLKQALNASEQIYSSFDLTLAFKGQHEQDLLTVMQKLDEDISPMYFNKQCELSADVEAGKRLTYSAEGNVDIRCELYLMQAIPREHD